MQVIQRGACDQKNRGDDFKPEKWKRSLIVAKLNAGRRRGRRRGRIVLVFGVAKTMRGDKLFARVFQCIQKVRVGGRRLAQRNRIEARFALRVRSEIIPDGVILGA